MYSSYSRRFGPSTNKDDLRQIVKEGWTPPKNSYDEVYPGLLLGDATAALSARMLKNAGVTHILNVASACDECLRKDICGTCVLTKASYYANMKFKGIQSHDEKYFPLFKHFEECTAFIDNALKNGGKVFVHCQQGISRSATIVVAYLISLGISAIEAVKMVRRKRPIFPNDGFLTQLCDLELRFQSHRGYA